jgi:ABC-type dipeptide/oligopeptide/nickel transport system permease component
MQLDPPTLILACAGIALAVLIAVVAGTLAARLFFRASGLDPADAATRGEDPVR